MEKYIYCENDFREAMYRTLKDMFNYDLNGFIVGRVLDNLKEYSNLCRFYDRNCSGCVGGNDDCDFAHQRGNAKDTWKKVVEGKLFDCPVRTNGTFTFARGVGEIKQVDISDRDKPPYPVIKQALPDAEEIKIMDILRNTDYMDYSPITESREVNETKIAKAIAKRIGRRSDGNI